MERMNGSQLFSLIVLFEIGSSVLFTLGIDAKQDAWIAILIAMLAGFALIWLYTEIHKQFPDLNWAEIIVSVLGKWLGIPLVILYALYFFYISMHNVRDFTELIGLTMLSNTPQFVLIASVILIMLYATTSGIEVIGRLGETFLPGFLLFLCISFLLIIGSGVVDLNRLKPFLEEGLRPVMKAAIPGVLNFPFGEMVVFLMIWNHISKKHPIRKITFFAFTLSGLLLTLSVIILIAVLDVPLSSRATIPFFEVIKMIEIANFFTNLDAIGVLLLATGGFIKMTVFFFGGVSALKSVLKPIGTKWLIPLCALLLLVVTQEGYRSLMVQRWVGLKVNIPYVHVPFQIIGPVFIFAVGWLKKKLPRSRA